LHPSSELSAQSLLSHPCIMSLTPEQVAIIKSTVPVLEAHGKTITTTFYANMLRAHPELNNIFNTSNQVNGHQAGALAGSLCAYAKNIDDLGKLSPAVERITHKHASLFIREEHYSIVGTYLIQAMGEVLGAALTKDVKNAWAAAYWQLAKIMIDIENALMKSAHGWTNWRDFVITRKQKESDEITSFYLESKSVEDQGKPLPSFRPGQYISVMMTIPALKYKQARQYSLSDAPGLSYYRISVKKEAGLGHLDTAIATAHPGYVSNVLHDTKQAGDVIQVSHPFGDFVLDDSAAPDAPTVFISAGVGLTPLISMLNGITSESSGTGRPISWINASKTTSRQAFTGHMRTIAKGQPAMRIINFVSSPTPDERQGVDFDHAGRLNLHLLDKLADLYLDRDDTRYYVCGPERFMLDMEAQLKALGVADPLRIRMELFGTGGVPRE
jgi:nitric oxide dioxygenase